MQNSHAYIPLGFQEEKSLARRHPIKKSPTSISNDLVGTTLSP
jgi:hypothetical protein